MAKTTAKDKGSDRGDKPPKRGDRGDRGDRGKGAPKGALVRGEKASAVPAEGMKGQVDGWMSSASRYLKAVRAEMKRITWPNRDQLRAYTIVVLLTLIFVTFFLWVCDVGFTWLFHKLVGQ